MYIDQLCREIRIVAVAGDPQLDRDGSGDLQVAIERRCRENHDIGTLGERSERLARAEHGGSFAPVVGAAAHDRLA